jgi:uncharacterized protein YggT (Ycf19 family)
MGNILRDLGNFIIGLVETVLVFRLLLKLFGANPATPFVHWVYETSEPLLNPFSAAFPAPTIQGQFTLEFTTLFALFVYAFVGFVLTELLMIMSRQVKGK